MALQLQEQENSRAAQRRHRQRARQSRPAPPPAPIGGVIGHEWYDPYGNRQADLEAERSRGGGSGMKDLLRLPGLGKKKKNRTDADKYAPGTSGTTGTQRAAGTGTGTGTRTNGADAGWDSDNEYATAHDASRRSPAHDGGSPIGTTASPAPAYHTSSSFTPPQAAETEEDDPKDATNKKGKMGRWIAKAKNAV